MSVCFEANAPSESYCLGQDECTKQEERQNVNNFIGALRRHRRTEAEAS